MKQDKPSLFEGIVALGAVLILTGLVVLSVWATLGDSFNG